MTSVSPEMLTVARESRGYSQTELARRLQVTQGYISKLEAGIIEMSSDRLLSFADALEYPVEFFRQHLPFGGSPCLYHRKRQTVRVTDLRRIEAECTIAGLVVRNVMHGLEVETDRAFPRMDIDEYRAPDEIAQILRTHWRLPSGPIRNLVLVIEAAGGIVVRHAFGTQKIDAISQWPARERPLFFVNVDIPWDRARFTLAHEIGHLVMHATPSPEMEAEADVFAAEFLMPAAEIAPDLEGVTLPKLVPLKQFWRVSIAALVRRAHDLGAITPRQYRYLFMQLGRLGYRKVEPATLDPEEPTVLADAFSLHRANGLSEIELAKVARLKPRELRARYDGKPHLRIVTA